MDVTPKIGKATMKTLTQPEGSGLEEGDFLHQGQTRQAVFSDSPQRAAPGLAWSSVLHFGSHVFAPTGPLGAFPEPLPEPALLSSDFSRSCTLVAFPGALVSFVPGTGKAKGPSLELCTLWWLIVLFSRGKEHFASGL